MIAHEKASASFLVTDRPCRACMVLDGEGLADAFWSRSGVTVGGNREGDEMLASALACVHAGQSDTKVVRMP